MNVTVVGVRHHSPACARLVAATIASLRPAYVLVEGPSDMNDRLDELRLDHELPIAVFSSYRDGDRAGASWSPFCDYSPEWVALRTADDVGAEFRFIDLPASHPAFAERSNRYADADRRYAAVIDRLCRDFGVDNVDTLWDHIAESDPGPDLADRLSVYFATSRGDETASASDVEREAYMGGWIRAASSRAGGRPIVVVCGGFHRPALEAMVRAFPEAVDVRWPDVPGGGDRASFLVPFSFKRLDAFDGYQSGMPSPEFYQQVWTHGAAEASRRLIESVATRLRERRQPVSTADLIAAAATSLALARVRGHREPTRTDVLDGLVSTLVSEALDQPAPWTGRGRLAPGTHPVIVEMIAALSGTRVGRLDPRTSLPPLVHDVTATLERLGFDGDKVVRLDLTDRAQRQHSVVLHRLRVLRIPGIVGLSGPRPGAVTAFEERWQLTAAEHRLVALIEAGAYGATLDVAATAALEERLTATGPDVEGLAETLFEAAQCGIDALPERVLDSIGPAVAGVRELAPLGRVLRVVLALWRHDDLYGLARSAALTVVMASCVRRILWLAEGVRGGAAPADMGRLHALIAARDAVRHAPDVGGIDREAAVAVMTRIAHAADAPPDLRGAALGFTRSLGVEPTEDAERAIRGSSAPPTLGDWLAGMFALAREEVYGNDPHDGNGLLDVLDTVVGAMGEHDFLVALPALRQAFTWFPPRERETIARNLLSRRGVTASGPGLLRLIDDPMALARARELDADVDALLVREGLVAG
jgi:hypothetical protein